MNRRRFLSLAGVGMAARAAAPARPNFLFVISDQFRADALGVAGNDWVRTPNLDALARGGVRFSNAYCPQALCTPSRASLMTGVYPHTSGLDHNLYKVPNAFRMPEFKLQPNWPTLLREAGYFTGYIGKWHLGEENPGLFDSFSGYNSLQPHWVGGKYRSDLETDEAMRFLDEHGSRPFALTVSYYPPHTPYDPPEKFRAIYEGREHAAYYGAVTAVDWDIGRLLGRLQEKGLAANTFVIFTADHGETFGLRIGSTNKTVSYEESAKVPLIFRWPAGCPRGIEYRGGVCTIDVMPTILEAAGLKILPRLEGHSRLGEIRRGQLGWREPVFLENITQKQVDGQPAIERAVRTERWKLILRDHPRNELYDLAADPGERHDRFADRASRKTARELAALIRRHAERTGDRVGVELAAKI